MRNIFRIAVSRVTLGRLAEYLCVLLQLPRSKYQQISSAQFAKIIGSKPSCLRQDFHNFGGFGKPGHPYDVNVLREELKKIFYVDQPVDILIIGATPLAEILIMDNTLKMLNIQIKGVVDFNQKIIGSDFFGHKVLSSSDVPALMANNNIVAGAITSNDPKPALQVLIDNDIRGVWNLSSSFVSVPEGFHLRYENIAAGLLSLLYNLNISKE